MTSRASRPAAGLRFPRKRIHQGVNLFESVGYLAGRELFVRKRQVRHLGGVDDVVLERKNFRVVFGGELPGLDGGPDGDLSDVLPLPGSIVHVRHDKRRDCANCRAKKRSNFWGY